MCIILTQMIISSYFWIPLFLMNLIYYSIHREANDYAHFIRNAVFIAVFIDTI